MLDRLPFNSDIHVPKRKNPTSSRCLLILGDMSTSCTMDRHTIYTVVYRDSYGSLTSYACEFGDSMSYFNYKFDVCSFGKNISTGLIKHSLCFSVFAGFCVPCAPLFSLCVIVFLAELSRLPDCKADSLITSPVTQPLLFTHSVPDCCLCYCGS